MIKKRIKQLFIIIERPKRSAFLLAEKARLLKQKKGKYIREAIGPTLNNDNTEGGLRVESLRLHYEVSR